MEYDRIRKFLPEEIAKLLEEDAYLRGLASQLDKMDADTVQNFHNNFLRRGDEKTVRGLERFLKINSKDAVTLDQRRELIAAYFIGNGRFGKNEIQQLIQKLIGALSFVAFRDGTIQVDVDLEIDRRLYFTDCLNLLQRRKPAHLAYDITILSRLAGGKNGNPVRYKAFEAAYRGQRNAGKQSVESIQIIAGKKNRNIHTVRIVHEEVFSLNGDYLLDGTRRLSGGITEEVI